MEFKGGLTTLIVLFLLKGLKPFNRFISLRFGNCYSVWVDAPCNDTLEYKQDSVSELTIIED